MSKEIYNGKGSSRQFMDTYAYVMLFLVVWFLGTEAYTSSILDMLILRSNGTIEQLFLPAYSTYSFLGIPIKIIFIAFYIALILAFMLLFGRGKKLAFYVDEGVLRKHKTWGIFSQVENFKIEDIDYISLSKKSLVANTRVVSTSNIISLVMKGIDIKVKQIFIAKAPEVAEKLAQEISKNTGIPLK